MSIMHLMQSQRANNVKKPTVLTEDSHNYAQARVDYFKKLRSDAIEREHISKNLASSSNSIFVESTNFITNRANYYGSKEETLAAARHAEREQAYVSRLAYGLSEATMYALPIDEAYKDYHYSTISNNLKAFYENAFKTKLINQHTLVSSPVYAVREFAYQTKETDLDMTDAIATLSEASKAVHDKVKDIIKQEIRDAKKRKKHEDEIVDAAKKEEERINKKEGIKVKPHDDDNVTSSVSSDNSNSPMSSSSTANDSANSTPSATSTSSLDSSSSSPDDNDNSSTTSSEPSTFSSTETGSTDTASDGDKNATNAPAGGSNTFLNSGSDNSTANEAMAKSADAKKKLNETCSLPVLRRYTNFEHTSDLMRLMESVTKQYIDKTDTPNNILYSDVLMEATIMYAIVEMLNTLRLADKTATMQALL